MSENFAPVEVSEYLTYDGLPREASGYMDICDWKSFQGNYEYCVSRFGKEIVDAYLKIKNIQIIPSFEEVHDEIINIIHFYLDVSNDTASILALWIIGTHFYKKFPTFPVLFLNASRGSGKTRGLSLMSHLCAGFSGKIQNNISLSSVFRAKGVLLFDECEKLKHSEFTELLTLLNGCYKKGSQVSRQKKVKTPQGESYQTESFDIYRPVALANIGGLDRVLQDRAIIIYMDKSFSPIICSRVEDFDTRLAPLKKKIELLVNDNHDNHDDYDNLLTYWNDFLTLKYQDSISKKVDALDKVDGLTQNFKLFDKIYEANIRGRSLEITFPLILIAKKINDSVFEDTLTLCSGIAKMRRESERDDVDTLILRFVSSKKTDIQEWWTVKELFNHFSLFASVDLSKEMSIISFGMALDRLQLISQRRRTTSDRQVKLNIERAEKRVGLFDAEK